MRKKIVLGLTVLLAVTMAGCGTKAEEKTIDAQALAKDLTQKVAYADDLNQIPQETAEELYLIDTEENAYVYVSSGATAEEVAVFEFADGEKAAEAVEAANTRIQEQTDSFADYIPEEVEKLEQAIVKQSGRYLVVCITDDTEGAEDVMDSYFE